MNLRQSDKSTETRSCNGITAKLYEKILAQFSHRALL